VQQNLRSFVGRTAFEKLARQWVIVQGKSGNLPFTPEIVGSHWSSRVQVDVVALNRQTRDFLIGECKWGTDRVDKQVVRDLIEVKAAQTLRELGAEEGWKVHYAVFSRGGFTPAAAGELQKNNGLQVNLAMIDQLLGREG
jgi:hypothetical protein